MKNNLLNYFKNIFPTENSYCDMVLCYAIVLKHMIARFKLVIPVQQTICDFTVFNYGTMFHVGRCHVEDALFEVQTVARYSTRVLFHSFTLSADYSYTQ